jgi:hypothetical protein
LFGAEIVALTAGALYIFDTIKRDAGAYFAPVFATGDKAHPAIFSALRPPIIMILLRSTYVIL